MFCVTSSAIAQDTTAKTPRRTLLGVLTMMVSGIGTQFGASAGALAFPSLGVFGVVGMRQVVAAVTVPWFAKPRFRTLTKQQWLLVTVLGISYGAMNFPLYIAMNRLGLGISVTLEFLGPLAVAMFSSRKARDFMGAIAAAAGIVILTRPSPTSDYFGIAMALLSALAWAVYILVNRSVGIIMPGLRAPSCASIISAAIWLPPLVVYFILNPPNINGFLPAIVCGLLSSSLPFLLDLITLRMIPVTMFGVFMSVNPVWAVLAGLIVLHQQLTLHELIGIVIIILANVLVTLPRKSAKVPKEPQVVSTATGAIRTFTPDEIAEAMAQTHHKAPEQ